MKTELIEKLIELLLKGDKPQKKDQFVGKRVLVRTHSAGVHFGTLVSQEGKQVVLKDARRIWRWRGANTLSEIALFGLNMQEYSRVSESVENIVLTEAIEIIPMSSEAYNKINKSFWGA